jgi:hypothetical protein
VTGLEAEVRPTDVRRLAHVQRTRQAMGMGRDSRVYVKATAEEQEVFRAVAEALGQGDNMSAAIRFVMFEKARELGLKPAKAKPKKSAQ